MKGTDRADVLVLDDEQSVLRAVSRLLQTRLAVDVECREQPRDALEILRTRPPKVFITDFRMPGMNGVEVLRVAQRIAPDTVRIMLTGHAEGDTVVEAVNAGRVYRYVTKPWDDDAFTAIVSHAIDNWDAAHGRRQAFLTADRERRALQEAVEKVGSIQRSILPADIIEVDHADAACSFTPYEHATGDYVDTMALPGGRTALIIGDVSGHGLGAAVFVFTARALLRSGLAEGLALPDVVDRTNRFLCRDMAEGRFLTLFVGIHDPSADSLVYLNAGHNPAMLLRNGAAEELRRTALPLGIDEHLTYDDCGETVLAPGQTFFAYTDGVIEARRGDELFGMARLHSLFESEPSLSPHALLALVRNAVRDWAGGEAQDDLTLLAYSPVVRGRRAEAEVAELVAPDQG